jgi:hypothetical protein
MASVRRSSNPWSAVVIIVASMLVTAGAAAEEAVGKSGSAVLTGAAGTRTTPSPDRPGVDNGRRPVWSARSPRAGLNTDDWDDRSDCDDDTDVPEKDWSRHVAHFGHDLITVDNDSRPGSIDALSIPSSSFQRLRC